MPQKPYTIHFSPLHYEIAKKVFQFCLKHRKHEFTIRELNLSRSEYTNFSQVQKFGLLYRITDDKKRIKGGLYGAPMRRIRQFLDGTWAVAEKYTVDAQSGACLISNRRILADQIYVKGWTTRL